MTTSTSFARFAAVVAGLGLVASSVFAFAPAARAATVDELQAQINALLAQIASLQGGSASASMTFTMDLTIGSTGAEVTALQNWLISKGYSIPAGATGYFGTQTQAALAAYQAANGISPAAGYFGPITRAKVNAMGGSTGGNTGGNTGGLSGGAGDIEDAKFVSGLNNEEVGEDEEDVEIVGLDIEADEGSDIELTSVRIVFDEAGSQPAGSDFEDYAAEVSVWFNGDEVGRVDADEFNDDNDWTRNVSLDRGAIIEAGEEGELIVAVSGINNLDSSDAGDTWSVEIDSVRFRDADGATLTEDTIGDIGDTRGFSFTTFAAAADAELTVRLTDGDDGDEINDARVIDVDDSSDTDNVDILAFTLEVEGDSDLTVDEFPVLFTSVGADVEDLVIEARLMLDGEEVGSETFGSSATTTSLMVFDDLDLTLDAGEEYEFTVQVDLASTDGTMDNGDTILASVTEALVDAQADIEDESGEDLPTGDRNGSAIGEAHALYDAGIMVTFVSATEEETFTADDASEDDQGTFKITFDVTAFDGDFRLDRSCEEGGGNAAGQGIEYTITNSGSNSTTCTVTSSKTDSEDTADTFEIDENTTRRVTLTVLATAGTTAFAEVALESINWGSATDDTNASYYTFNLDEFKTDALNLAAL